MFKSRTTLYLPYIVLAIIVALYSAFWFFGKSKAEEKIAAIFEARGDISCDNHAITGFPFSYILTCDKASFTRGEDRIDAIQIKAIVKPWNPRHVIAEITTPLVISPKGKDPIVVKAESMSLSVSENTQKERRLSVVMSKGEVPNVSFASGEFHLLHIGDIYKLSQIYADVKFPLGALKQVNSSFLGLLNRENRTLKVNELTLFADDYRLKLAGDFTLTNENRPDGRANIAFTGLDSLLKRFGVNISVISFLGRKTTIDGVEAQEISLDIKNGRVMVGPLAVYTIPPLDFINKP